MSAGNESQTLVRPRGSETSERRRALFEEALAVIERRYDDDRLDLDGLSREIFTSRRQLQRAFAEAGTTVRERLHAVRMERAAELLRGSSLPVARVAVSVGYRDPVQFAKAFKRYYQMAPAQWRRSAGSEEAIADVIAIDCRCGCQRSEQSQLGSRRAQEAPVSELRIPEPAGGARRGTTRPRPGSLANLAGGALPSARLSQRSRNACSVTMSASGRIGC